MNRLTKDDPVYYKAEMNKLIKQAKENGLEVGYEIYSHGERVTRVQVYFMNAIGEIAGSTVFEKQVLEVEEC